jgi:hypothetical protein
MMNKTKKHLFHFFSLFVPLALIAVVLHPDLRKGVRSQVMTEERLILSSVIGKILKNDHQPFKVLKVKKGNQIFLEIYSLLRDGRSPIIGKLLLEDVKDGFFNFSGEATNLVLKDVDGDENMEILAPTFDGNLAAKLNVFKFNQETGQFFKMMAPM